MKKIFFFAASLLFLILFPISEFNIICKNTVTPHNITIIAHRGASNLAPENTLSAIKEAIKQKTRFIEIDVHLTKDNIPVVIHDYSIDRTTNGSGEIREKNYEELLQYDAGSWFDEKYKNEKIPTLEQIIKMVNGRANLIVEIKGSLNKYPEIVKQVNRIISENNATSWCTIHTFNNDILKEFANINPQIKLQKLVIFYIPYLNFYFDTAPHFNGSILNKIEAINIYYRFINSCVVNFFHSKGIKVNAWTVNNISQIKKLKSLGVDGIITDISDQVMPEINKENPSVK